MGGQAEGRRGVVRGRKGPDGGKYQQRRAAQQQNRQTSQRGIVLC